MALERGRILVAGWRRGRRRMRRGGSCNCPLIDNFNSPNVHQRSVKNPNRTPHQTKWFQGFWHLNKINDLTSRSRQGKWQTNFWTGRLLYNSGPVQSLLSKCQIHHKLMLVDIQLQNTRERRTPEIAKEVDGRCSGGEKYGKRRVTWKQIESAPEVYWEAVDKQTKG